MPAVWFHLYHLFCSEIDQLTAAQKESDLTLEPPAVNSLKGRLICLIPSVTTSLGKVLIISPPLLVHSSLPLPRDILGAAAVSHLLQFILCCATS